MAIKLVVADEQEVVRTGLASLFRGSPIHILGEASSGRGLLGEITKHRPELVLMDILLSDGDGLQVIEKIHAKDPDVRVVVLSSFDNPTYVARSRAWGACDYLLKQFNREQLISAITQIAAGKAPTDLGLMQNVAAAMSGQPMNGEQYATKLTLREAQVLRHLGYGLSNREIGRSMDISVETVKEHVQNILRKLNLSDRTQAAVWAVRKRIV